MLMRMMTAACLVAWLSGCALLRPSAPTHADPALPPLAATPADLPASASQVLRAAFADQEVTLQCSLASIAGGWRSACVSAAGLRVLTLNFSADRMLSGERGPGVPAQLDPQRVAADIQLAFWPLALLQDALRGTAWTLSEPYAGMRRLRHEGRLVAEVHHASGERWNGRLWISNYRYGYSLQIESRVAEPAHGP